VILASFEKTDNSKSEADQIRTIIENTESVFLELYDEFWSYYYTFGGKRLKKKGRLIGNERASIILINIIIPILLTYARKREDRQLEEKLFKAFKQYSKLSPNNKRLNSIQSYHQIILQGLWAIEFLEKIHRE